MQQVMDLLLIRFAIIVGGITLLIIAGFTTAIALKRRGRLGQARRLLEPAVRAWADRPADRQADRPAGRQVGRSTGVRYAGPGASGGPRGGGPSGLGWLAVRGALHYLDRAETRRTEGTGDRRDR